MSQVPMWYLIKAIYGIIVFISVALYVSVLKGRPPREKIVYTAVNALFLVMLFALGRSMEFVYKWSLVLLFNLLLFWIGGMLTEREEERISVLEDQLVNALLVLTGSLKAGRTLEQGFELVARSLPDPIASEFKQVLQDQKLGIPFEEALKNMMKRVNSKDFDTFVTATLFQKETGGNIIALYDQITFAVAERRKLKGKLDSITVQGRYSGYLVAMLPVVIFLFLNIVNPAYVKVFTENEWAKLLLLGALLLEIVGVVVIKNIVGQRLE